MKFRTSVATAVAATAVVLAVGAVPANAATAVAKPTSLTIKSSVATAHYGQWVKLTAHLGATASNRTVEIDNGASLVKKGHVDTHGNLTAWVKAAHNTTFVAKFAGDSRDKAATAHVRVNTTALVGAAFVHGSPVNGYTVYSISKGQHPQLVIAVAPNKTGETVTTHIQVWQGGTWVNVPLTVNEANAKLLNGSSVLLSYSKLPAGVTFREYVSYKGDATNVGSATGWKYAKTVK